MLFCNYSIILSCINQHLACLKPSRFLEMSPLFCPQLMGRLASWILWTFFFIILLFFYIIMFWGVGSICVWDCIPYLLPLGDWCQCPSCTRYRIRREEPWTFGGKATSPDSFREIFVVSEPFLRRFSHGTHVISNRWTVTLTSGWQHRRVNSTSYLFNAVFIGENHWPRMVRTTGMQANRTDDSKRPKSAVIRPAWLARGKGTELN